MLSIGNAPFLLHRFPLMDPPSRRSGLSVRLLSSCRSLADLLVDVRRFTQDNLSYTPSQIVSIDGQDTAEFLNADYNKVQQVQDPDALVSLWYLAVTSLTEPRSTTANSITQPSRETRYPVALSILYVILVRTPHLPSLMARRLSCPMLLERAVTGNR